MKTHRTTCKVGACEPFCGVEIDVEEGRLTGIRPNPDHPITQGYVCIKGMHVPDYVNHPERLLQPMARGPNGLEPVDWNAATRQIGERLRRICDEHGPSAIATYWGNAADSVSITLANTFCHAFGSPNSFNVLSLEYTDRGAVAERVLGNENLIQKPLFFHKCHQLKVKRFRFNAANAVKFYPSARFRRRQQVMKMLHLVSMHPSIRARPLAAA